jgi:hypothetical protein
MRQARSCFGALAFFFIFAAIGGGLALWGWTILQNARASASWPKVSGRVTDAFVNHSQDAEGGNSYSPEVSYTYVVDERPFQGSRIKFGELSYSSRNRAQEIVNRYPVGQPVAVYHDPDRPERAVLEPGVSGGSYLVLGIGLLFVTLAFIIAPLILLFNRRR